MVCINFIGKSIFKPIFTMIIIINKFNMNEDAELSLKVPKTVHIGC